MPAPEDLGGGRWRVSIFIGKNPATGKQVRKKITFTARGIRAARTKVADLERDLRSAGPEQTLTLHDATERWWESWQTRDRAATTARDYRGIIDQHLLRSSHARRKVAALTVGDIDHFYEALVKSGLSPARVRRIHAVLRQVLDQCARDRVVDVNVAALARLPDQRTKAKPMPPTELIEAIVATAAAQHEAKGRVLRFAALTGLRRGELAGLRWDRVDLDHATLLVDTAVAGVAKTLIIKDPKAHQAQTITLGDQAVETLRAQWAWQLEQLQAVGEVGEVAPVWVWQVEPPYDRPLWPDTLTAWWTAARRHVPGGDKIRLHDARHWHASALIDAGATVADVQRRLRHQSIATTMRYAHADESRQRELDRRLPRLGG